MVKTSGKDPTVRVRLNCPTGRILGNQPVNGDVRYAATAICGMISDRGGGKITAIYLETDGCTREIKAVGGRVEVPAVYTALGRMIPGR